MFLVLDQNELTDDYPVALARKRASQSALRLLSYAINLYPSMRASLRSSTENTSIFLATLEAILLTPLSTAAQQSYVQILTVFLDEQGNFYREADKLNKCFDV
jgi:DNA-binding PucR family transcriptional regulator